MRKLNLSNNSLASRDSLLGPTCDLCGNNISGCWSTTVVVRQPKAMAVTICEACEVRLVGYGGDLEHFVKTRLSKQSRRSGIREGIALIGSLVGGLFEIIFSIIAFIIFMALVLGVINFLRTYF